MQPLLVSACLLGLYTRFDGSCKHYQAVFDFLGRENRLPVPVCPEQLAGLPTPRPASCFAAGDGESVLDGSGRLVQRKDGRLMNELFLKGALETMKIARLCGCRDALLKERSPSCGVRQVYLGDRIVSGRGITAALLNRNRMRIFSEEEI